MWKRRLTSACKLLGLMVVGTLVLTACGGRAATSKQYHIAGFALVPFTQIQDMFEGFKKAAASNCGLVEGQNTAYILDFAQGQQSTLQLLAKHYVESKVDLILSLDSPSLVTSAAATKTIPIVEVAATFPLQYGVIKSLEHPGTNITGGTDYIDPNVVVDTLRQAIPSFKRLGMPYNPSDPASVQFRKNISPVLEKDNIQLISVPATSTAEIEPAIRSLVGRTDVVLIGADNLALAAAGTIAAVAKQNHIPSVSYIGGVAQKGILMDLGVDYQVLGESAGKKACDILTHGANPGDIPITGPTPSDIVLTINTTTMKDIGISIPSDVMSRAKTI